MKKLCFVPSCLNSSESTPYKLFIFVPRNPVVRKTWFVAVRRTLVKTSYCCEDHFNLKEDSIDFSFYMRTGKSPRIKTGITPHLFPQDSCKYFSFSQLQQKQEISSEGEENSEPEHPCISTTSKNTRDEMYLETLPSTSSWLQTTSSVEQFNSDKHISERDILVVLKKVRLSDTFFRLGLDY